MASPTSRATNNLSVRTGGTGNFYCTQMGEVTAAYYRSTPRPAVMHESSTHTRREFDSTLRFGACSKAEQLCHSAFRWLSRQLSLPSRGPQRDRLYVCKLQNLVSGAPVFRLLARST